MDISTRYLGITLRSPLVVSASPLSDSITDIQRMEAAGAGAVVMYSLFEEQIRYEREKTFYVKVTDTENLAQPFARYTTPPSYNTDANGYLEHIRAAKTAVGIPIIASLNGSTIGGWTRFAKQLQEAGADAVELNIYNVPADLHMSAAEIEAGYLDIVRAVRRTIQIPIAVKISPFFTSIGHFAKQLELVGANGIVLFNRFYQPEIDPQFLKVSSNLTLSTSETLRLPLRWIALLYGRVNLDLAATGGVHTVDDVAKSLLAGANVAMLTSALFKHGIDHLTTLNRGVKEWLGGHGFSSVQQVCGKLSQINADDPTAYERAQYTRALTNYKP